MKRYGIIGGTFDPIHNAHLYIAYESLKQLELDKVIFMPAGIQPFKTEKKVTDSKHRYEMVKRAIQPYKEFSVSDYEIEKQGLSYTYKTLGHFKKICEDESKLYFITGADCLFSIDRWKEADKIFESCTLVVFTRGGFNKGELYEQKKNIEDKYNSEIIILDLNELEISSTDIRKRIKDNKRIDFFVPEVVNEYIKENSLYIE